MFQTKMINKKGYLPVTQSLNNTQGLCIQNKI